MLELVLPWVIVGLFVLFILSLLKKWWRFALFCLAVMFVTNILTQSFPLRFRGSREAVCETTGSSGLQTLKLMTFNIDGSKMSTDGVERMREFILAQQADIVLLIECFGEGPLLLHEALKDEFGYSSYGKVGREQRLYSKFPIESSTLIKSDSDRSSANYRYELSVLGQPLHLYCVHLASNNQGAGGKGYSTPDDIEDMEQFKGYMRKIVNARSQRSLEARAIADEIRGLDGGLCVVMGDFNDVGGSAPLRRLRLAGMRDAWWRGGLGYGATYRKLPFRIDHILYSSPLRLQDVARLRTTLSDHNALTATFMIDNKD